MVKKTIKRNKYKYNIGGFLKDTASSLGSISSIVGAAYGLGNTLFGSQKNEQAIQNVQNNIDSLKNANFNTQSADSLLADYQNQNLIGNINKNDLGSDGLFSNKIEGIADDLRFKANQANIAFFNNLNRASQQLSTNKLIQDQLANNIAAYGGPINMRYTGTMSPFGNRFMSNVYDEGGGIYIKPSKRGTFTAAAKKHGKGVQEFASQVLENKENYSPAMIKKAQFAKNAAKFKHSNGGYLNEFNNDNFLPYSFITPFNQMEIFKSFATGGYTDGDEEGNSPISRFVSNENKNVADKLWAAAEFTPILGNIMGVADVANDVYNMAKTNNVTVNDVGNLLLDTAGLIPGVSSFRALAKGAKLVKAQKTAKKLENAAKSLRATTGKGVKETRDAVNRAKDWSKRAEQEATKGLLSNKKQDLYRGTLKAREATKFNYGVLNSVQNTLNPFWTNYNIIQNVGTKTDATNDFFNFVGSQNNKKALGGELTTKNTTFNNGITYINNGDTHENNAYEGVQIGMDNEGVPNLVEQDELIYNDYVIPKRVKATKELLSSVNLPTKYAGKSLSDIGKKLSKESQETPNDPISKNTLDKNMNKLISINEVLRQMNDTQNNEQMNNRQFATGGNTNDDPDTDIDITWDIPLGDFTVVAPKQSKINNDIKSQKDDNISSSLEDLRFAPAVGAGIGVLQNLFSKPNYSRADYLANTARRVGTIDPVTYSPLGDYLTYKPQDTDYIANRIAAQAAGTRRAINDIAGGNRAAAIGSTLMSDYNTQIQEADAIRKANEDNWNRLVGVTTFNRDTNKTNAEMALKTAMANQEAKLKAGQMELNGIDRAMTLKDTIDAQRAASLSGNLSNLFDSLGNIGIDALNRRDAKFNILHSDYSLPMDEFARWFGKDNAKKEAKRRGFTDEEIKNMNFAKGGKLKRKKGEYSYAKL